MKRVWVKAVPWNKEVALAAMECEADALWVPPGWVSDVRKSEQGTRTDCEF